MKRSGVVFVGLAVCCVLVAVWISLRPLASTQTRGSTQRGEYLYIRLDVEWCHEIQQRRDYIPHTSRKAIWDNVAFAFLGNEAYVNAHTRAWGQKSLGSTIEFYR